MGTLDIWLLAIGLAMDCFAVSITSGIIIKRYHWPTMLAMALSFGLFQGLMPVIGWFCFVHFSDLLQSIDHWIAFGLLAYLGGKMIWDSFHEDEVHHFNPARPLTILVLAVATSIDALAVGISFACLDYKTIGSLAYPVTVIGLVSFVLSVVGLVLGTAFGLKIERRIKPELVGGIILILIGVKILCEHLGLI